MDQSLCDMMELLWNKYHSDIVLEVHHILTEPVCPSVKISVERTGEVLAHVVGDSIEDAVGLAMTEIRQKFAVDGVRHNRRAA